MLEVRVDSNIQRVKLQFAALTRDLEEKAMVRAINRAGDQSVTAASREIRRVYNLKASTARSQIKVRDRARRGKLFFTIRIFSRRIPLVEFVRGSRQITVRRARRGRGVTVEVRRGSSKVIRHAFIARMPSGHLGVMVRATDSRRGGDPVFRRGKGSGQSGRRWGQPDLPVAELTTLSVPRMFLERSVRSAVAQIASDSFSRNFEQQLRFLTTQAR